MKVYPDLHHVLIALGFRAAGVMEWPAPFAEPMARRTVYYRPADSPTFALRWTVLGNGAEHWDGDHTDEFTYTRASDAIDRKGKAPQASEWRRDVAARVRAAESLMSPTGGQTSIL